MGQPQNRSAESFSATVRDIQSYPKYTRRLPGTLPPPLHTTVNDLVKSGKLTLEQAKMVLGTNQMSMFGSLLDVLQNPYGADSASGAPASTDPASALLDALKANDNNSKSRSDWPALPF